MEANLNLWLTIIACGIVTFLIRFSFIAIHGRVTIPDWFTRALTFVPIAVLSAITMPEILIQDNVVDVSILNPRLIAGIAAALVAWRTKNVMLTIGAGMVVLWGLQLVMK